MRETKKHRELADILTELSGKLMDADCEDLDTLTLMDKALRRTLYDIHPGWVRWGCYMITQIFNRDHARYYSWAEANCKSLPVPGG